MSVLYNEYLTGADREVAIIVAESDAQVAKLNVLFETVDAQLELNKLSAEAKVLSENGTYDDLTMLYKEATEDAAVKKNGILATLLDAVASFFQKISSFITSKFGKKVEETIETLPEDDIKVDKSFLDKINIFKKGWDILKDSVEKIKSGNFDSIGDVAKAWAPIATAVASVTATGAVIAVKRKTILEWIVWVKDTVLKKVNTAISAAKLALGIGAAAKAIQAPSKPEKEGNVDQKANKSNTKEHESEPGIGRMILDKGLELGKAALNKLKEFAGWLSTWLGNLWSKLPFNKKDAEQEIKASGLLPANAEETKTESVTIFGVMVDPEETYLESEMTDEEYSELCELFDEI